MTDKVPHLLRTAAFTLCALLVLATAPALAAPPDVDLATKSTIREWAAAAFQLGIILAVLAAAIYIAIGAYLYFAAAGNAELSRAGKDYITRAITGLVLALLAWVLLNTLSTQFTTLTDPSL